MPFRSALLALLIGVHLPLHAAPLRVGVEEMSPPKWQHYVADRPTGYCADLLDALAGRNAALRFSFAAQAVPQKRMEAELQEGSIDLVCGLTRTPRRTASFHYVEFPIYAMDYVLFARAADPLSPQSWDAVRALGADGVILLNYDSSAIGRLQHLGGLQLDASGRTIEHNFRKLLSGRGRFFFYHRPGGFAEMQRLKLQHELRIVEPALDTQAFFLLLGRHVPVDVRASLLETLQALDASGELRALQQRWALP